MRANKSTNLINIMGLAISISAVLIISMWVKDELTFDTYHKDSEQIYLLSEWAEGVEQSGLVEDSPYASSSAIANEIPDVYQVASAIGGEQQRCLVKIGDRISYQTNVLYVDNNWLDLFDYPVLTGSLHFFRDKKAHEIAISKTKAEQLFGKGDAVGKTLHIDSTLVTVSAVYDDLPANLSIKPQFLIPAHIYFKGPYTKDAETEWGYYASLTFVKLKGSSDIRQVEEKLTALTKRNQPFRAEDTYENRLIPLEDLHFERDFVDSSLAKGNKNTTAILSLLGFVLLLIACINFINLNIARISTRIKEVGIRKVTGANKKQLFTQVLFETGLSVTLAGLLTIALTTLLTPWYNLYFNTSLEFNPTELSTALFLIGLLILITLLTGFYPALLINRISPLHFFQGKTALPISNTLVKKSLVTVQLVVMMTLVIGTLVMYFQFRFVALQINNYAAEETFTFNLPAPETRMQAYDVQAIEAHKNRLKTIKAELIQQSSIEAVTRINGPSLFDNKHAQAISLQWDGYPKASEEKPQIGITLWVDPGYRDVGKLEVIEGRWFDPNNTADRNNIVINEKAVKAFGLKEPVVGTLYHHGEFRSGSIIGVVKDFHHTSLHLPIQPIILDQEHSDMGMKFIVRSKRGQVAQALEATKATWDKHFPAIPFDYVFLDQELNKLYKNDRYVQSISLVFSVLAIVLASLGVFAMAMFNTQQRTKEIGIRKVLGASIAQINLLLCKEFGLLISIALLVASPTAAWFLTKWLDNFAYRIELSWWIFGLAAVFVAGIVLLTAMSQSWRAARANPVDSLRDE